MGLLLLLICGGVRPLIVHAQTQAFQVSVPTSSGPVFLIPEVSYSAAELGDLTSTDLSAMPATWWKEVVKRHVRLLTSDEDAVRERTLQNLIFFIGHYPEATDYQRAVKRLLAIYQTDAVEEHRIMALAALEAIGNAWAMAEVRASVHTEESERVRRHTLRALVSYYRR